MQVPPNDRVNVVAYWRDPYNDITEKAIVEWCRVAIVMAEFSILRTTGEKVKIPYSLTRHVGHKGLLLGYSPHWFLGTLENWYWPVRDGAQAEWLTFPHRWNVEWVECETAMPMPEHHPLDMEVVPDVWDMKEYRRRQREMDDNLIRLTQIHNKD